MMQIDTATFFQTWFPLGRLSVADMPRFGSFAAVYAFRDSTTGNILKYGNTDSLRRRIFANYLGGVGGSTTQRIHADLLTNEWVSHVDVAWSEAKDKQEATRIEKELRTAYWNTHKRLPPWDRQR